MSFDPDNQVNYELEVESYFESIRAPFEQTLKATKKNYPKLFVRLAWLSGFIGISAVPFFSSRVAISIFHTQSINLLGKTYEIKEIASGVFVWCGMLGTMVFGGIIRILSRFSELNRAGKPLPPRHMAFALSYAIVRELDHFERNKMELHQRMITNLWGKLLTYLRWTLESSLAPESTSFHKLPPRNFLVVPDAQRIAESFNWVLLDKPAYSIITGLNNLHLKLSPRLSTGFQVGSLIPVFRQLGNFLYTSIPEHRKDERLALWGYSELSRCADTLNSMSRMAEVKEATPAERFKAVFARCGAVFTHSNIAVAFFAWWFVFQALFAALIATAFHYFPNLTMNSQAMVALIGGPIAAAISMVGISRKFQ